MIRNFIFAAAVVACSSLYVVDISNAQLVLSDDFTTTGNPDTNNVNFNLAGRQSGPAATVTYFDGGNSQTGNPTNVGQPGSNPNYLLLAFGGYAGSNLNIATAPNVANQQLLINADFYPTSGNPTDWLSMTIQSPNPNTAFPIVGSGDFGFLYRTNTGIQVFNNGGAIDTIGSSVGGGSFSFIVSNTAGTGSAFNGAGGRVQVYQAGTLVNTYNLNTGFTATEYLSFGSAGTTVGGIDNLTISTFGNGNGTWVSTANGDWSTASNWAGGVVANGANNTATFLKSTGVTVNLDAPRTIGHLQFENANYTVSGANTLTLDVTAGNANVFVGDTHTATVSTVIAGSDGFLKTGLGTLVLNGANTYTGVSQFQAGIVNVASLSDYGVAGSLGARLAVQEVAAGDGIGLHFRGGTLQYTGSTPTSTNREIRMLNGNGATIDASGSVSTATLSFTHTGANTNLFDTPGTRTLTLTGTNTGDNLFAIQLTNQGGSATSLTKNGVGTWLLGGGAADTFANTNTGNTLINDGILVLNKAAGTNAISGNVQVGDGSGTDTLRLAASNQIADTSIVTIHGPSGGNSGKFELYGFDETVGGIASLGTAAVIQVRETGSMGVNSTLTVNTAADQTFGGIIRDNNAGGSMLTLNKSGTAQLLLNQGLAANSYSGGTNVNDGTIRMGYAGALGSGNVSIANDANVLLWFNTGSSTVTNNFTLNGLGGSFGGGNKGAIYADGGGGGFAQYTLSGTITLNATSDLSGNTANNLLVSGQITGAGGLNKGANRTDENGKVILTNASNNYAGVTTVNRGVLEVTVNGALGTPGSGTVVNSGGQLLLTSVNYSNAEALTLNGTGVSGNGALRSDTNSTYAGPITLGSNAFIVSGTAGNSLDITGGVDTNGFTAQFGGAGILSVSTNPIIGTGSVHKTNSGTLNLLGTNNTYTGETIFGGGIVNVASLADYGVASSLGARTFAQENLTVTGISLHFQGGTLQYTGSTPQSTNRQIRVINGNAGTIDASGSNPGATLSFTHSGPNINLFDTAGTRTFTLTGTNTGANVFAIPLTDQGANSTSLTKTGTGTWHLTNTGSTYTGVTSIEGGILNVASVADYGVASSLGARTSGQDVATNIGILFRGGTLQYTGSTAQNTNRAIRISTTGGGGTIDASGSNPAATLSFTRTTASPDFFENNGNRTLTLTGTNTGANTFAMPIQEAGGTTTVTKTGTGTWVLSGSSTYSGITSVNNGVLKISNNNALGNTTGNTVVASGASLEILGGLNYSTAEPVTLSGAGFGGPNTGAFLMNDGGSSTFAGPITLGSHATIGVFDGSTLTLTGGINKNGFNVTFLGNGAATNTAIINTVGISGPADLIVDNMTVDLNAANTYVGPTTLQNGVLNANVASALPTGTFSAVSIDATSLLNLNNGIGQTVASLSGTGTVDNTAAGTNTLTIEPSAGTTNFGGSIQNSGGTLNVTKNGAGTQQLSGANTYTGTTSVTAGTLELLTGGSLQNGAVSVTGGTFLQSGGTNNVTGATGTGNLDITGGAYTLAGGTLNFGDTVGAGGHHAVTTLTPGADYSELNIAAGASFNFAGGTLMDVSEINPGSGTFTQSNGNFVIGQQVSGAPPDYAAITVINGGFSMIDGVLSIDVFGPELTPLNMSDAEPIDLLIVTGTASLNGLIDLDFENGFMPEFGEIFTLVKASEFVIGPDFGLSDGFLRIVPNGPGMGFSLQAIVPEPGTVAMWSLLALAAGGFAARMRGRRRK